MTLSGKSDFQERRQRALKARHERAEAARRKRPWQFPLIIGIAVAVIVVVLVVSIAQGTFLPH